MVCLKCLADLTTRRVIVGVLMLLFILPLFEVTTYHEEDTLMRGGLEMVVETYKQAMGELQR